MQEVVPKLGPRMKILQKINLHRLNNSLGSTNSLGTATLESSEFETDTESTGSAKKKRKSVPCSPLTNLRSFLETKQIGGVLLRAQERFGYITSDHRNSLVRIIVDYLIESNERYKNDDFDQIAENIVNLFPRETKGIYYIPPNLVKKMSNGKLVDRYRNVRRVITSATKKQEEVEASKAEESQVDSAVKADILWLSHNSEPWAQVIEKWNSTYVARKDDLIEGENLKSLFQKWPCLSGPLGWQLFEADFDKIYPGKANVLLEEWPNLATQLWKLILKHRANPLTGAYEDAPG